ncbi:MAG: FAD-binding oxidoreductase [Ignisphaera sp.]|uniref:FAD-binding oxidoreductase n=1 Tax=Ignisphaera aggregans TaxID=334771 RepID=A0A7C4NQ31_9CREN
MTIPRLAIDELKSIVGDKWVVEDPLAIERYLYDETALPVRPKANKDIVVVKPGSVEEVSGVIKVANKYRIPVYPRGGGTSLVGGAVPTAPGIVLCFERMDKVQIDKDNMVAEVEAGATLGKLIEEAEKHNLMFPAHPGDEGASIGGLIACNAGGSRAIRTGVMRNYVLGLEVVLPTGDVIKLGGKTIKNNMGFNLAHLFVGSEGLLGIIVKACLRLYPRWRYTATVILPYSDRASAFRVAKKILFSGLTPLAIEYFDKRVIEASAKHLGVSWPIPVGQYYTMIILAEPMEETVFAELELIDKISREEGGEEPYIFQRDDEQKHVLNIRSEIYTSLKPETFDILDTTVPVGAIDKFIEKVNELEKKHSIWLPAYGHVGDGNIHIHILNYPNFTLDMLEKIKDEIYDIAIELGGTITGEHGIGYIRKKYVERLLGDTWVKTVRALKQVLDPNNILNPDKVLP